jgi:hypothetical protein
MMTFVYMVINLRDVIKSGNLLTGYLTKNFSRKYVNHIVWLDRLRCGPRCSPLIT